MRTACPAPPVYIIANTRVNPSKNNTKHSPTRQSDEGWRAISAAKKKRAARTCI
jgi:hypothetical protein